MLYIISIRFIKNIGQIFKTGKKRKKLKLKKYFPHLKQQDFHATIGYLFRFVAFIAGIRSGKTFAGAREAGRQTWNSRAEPMAGFGIIAPTFNILDRTTWKEFRHAMRPLILKE